MSEFAWVLHDSSGSDLRTSESFESKAAAEAWMGTEGAALRDEGADSVSLTEDGALLYKMSLQEG
jgi:hypothetical protein